MATEPPGGVTISLASAGGERTAVGRLGMRLFLTSLSVLFAAAAVGHLVIRLRSPHWPPAGWPGLPTGLWGSTALIVVSGVTMQLAVTAARRGRQRRLRLAALATTLLGVAFLLCQAACWAVMVANGAAPQQSLLAFAFYVLTALHALHVVGGLAPLSVVTVRAWQGRYSPRNSAGVEYVATYWHFLGVMWLLLYGVLAI